MIADLERILEDLAGGAAREDLVVRLRDVVDAARGAAVQERILREVARSRNLDIEERIAELSLWKELSDALVAHAEPGGSLDAAMDVVRRAMNADRIALLRRSPESEELQCVAASGSLARPGGGGAAADRGPDRFATEWVASQREPLIVPDLAADSRFPSEDGGNSTGSLVALPLGASGRSDVRGALVLRSRDTGFFHGRHARVLRIVAAQLAAALRTAELRVELDRELRIRDEDVSARTEDAARRTEDLNRRNEMITDLYLSLEEAREQLETRNADVLQALAFSDGIVDNVTVGIGVIDHDGSVLKWNRAMEAITGGQITKEAVLGRNIREVPVELRKPFALASDLDEALAGGRFKSSTGREVPLPEGRSIYVNASLLPVPSLGDGPDHVMIVVEDVTANIALHAQQLKAERLAAITETMVSVNHEVNNPLAVVLGYTQMLRMRLGSGPMTEKLFVRLQSDLARIEAEALRIEEITAKLAALIEPVVTAYPASGDVRMIDLQRSR